MSGRHIFHVFPGFGPGGTQMRTVQLMGMLPGGVRHTILAMDGIYGCLEHVPDGVEVTSLTPPPRRSFLGMGRYLASLLDEHRPDAVMTYNWGAIEMVLGARIRRFQPLIHHEDGFGPEEAHRFLRRRIWIRRWLLRAATAVAVPSKNLQDLAVRVWKQKAARVRYLPNGVDLSRFRPVDRSALDGPLVIGHVAHLRPEKNQDLLITAFACSQAKESARLRIVGDGAEASALRRLAEELEVADRVDFVGPVADTAPEYRQMDIFTLSSDTEQMPLTVLEAMASGLPVVSTDVGDVRVMVHASNREFMTPKADAGALAAAFDRLIADVELTRRIGRDNRAHCEATYAKDECYQAWVDFYSQILCLPD